jgi:capsular polysaccharide biosynthesis protein
MKVPELYAATLHDVVALPRQLLVRDGKILPDSFRRISPRHSHVHLERTDKKMLRGKADLEPRQIIEEPVYYFDGEHMGHYGHFTLEVLSRLWHWSEYASRSGSRPQIVCTKVEGFALELLKPFGIERRDIHFLDKPTLLKNVTVASQAYILEQGVSDRAFEVWNTIGKFYDRPSGPVRIYVSRLSWQKQRILLNESDVEGVFRQYGFDVIYPEQLSVAEQVGVFRNAEIVAGPSGSGLYNCVYSGHRGRRVILASSKFVTFNDVLVNQGTHSTICYITGAPAENKSGMFANWTIDLKLLESFLKDFLARPTEYKD